MSYQEEFNLYVKTKVIKKSKEIFKIKLFLEKAENSLLIAKHIKNINPDKIEEEDLELLNQSYNIFEQEYVVYFKDAQIESHTARYTAIKSYDERRLDQIFNNATKFIAKIGFILEN